MNRSRPYARAVIVIGVFTALSAVGGLIKLGSATNSIALDSSAGYFAAAFFSPWVGAVVGILGHLASSATGGFPLGWLHLAVALQQGLWSLVFGGIIRYSDRIVVVPIAAVIAVSLNGVLAPLLLIPLKPEWAGVFKSLIPLLVIASAVNVGVASGAMVVLSRYRSKCRSPAKMRQKGL